MPFDNIANIHISQADMDEFDAALAKQFNILTQITTNLSPKERKKYGNITNLNRLFIDKDKHYHEHEPALDSPDVNWPEFDADYADARFGRTRTDSLLNLVKMLRDFTMAHETDLHKAALTDFSFTSYRTERSSPGFAEKRAALSKLMPKTGKKASKKKNENN